MSTYQNTINQIYNELLGRSAVFGTKSSKDADYWKEQLAGGKTISDIIGNIKLSSEFTNRKKVAEHLGWGDMSTWDDEILDQYVLPGGSFTQKALDAGLSSGKSTWSGTESDLSNIGTALGFTTNPDGTQNTHSLTGTAFGGKTGGNYNEAVISNIGDFGPGNVDNTTPDDTTPDDTTPDDTAPGGNGDDTITGGGGGGGSDGMSRKQVMQLLKGLFSNNWTPWGYGWGGYSTSGAAINRSNASRMGRPYKGIGSSFNRTGQRLTHGAHTPINTG